MTGNAPLSGGSLYLTIAVIALVTALLRFAPFLLLSGKKTPKTVLYLGEVLPYAVMGMLVVYCLKGMNFASFGGFLPEILSSCVVVGSYLLRRSTLFSILIGTVCYMLLVQFVFV